MVRALTLSALVMGFTLSYKEIMLLHSGYHASWVMSLKLGQAYSGCLSVLQIIHEWVPGSEDGISGREFLQWMDVVLDRLAIQDRCL